MPWIIAGVLGACLIGAGILISQNGKAAGEQAALPTVTATATAQPSAPAQETVQVVQPPAVTVTQRVEVQNAPPVYREEAPRVSSYWRIVSKSSSTSWGFANNVRDAYNRSGLHGSSGSISGVYSPATGLTYSLYCSGGSQPTCSGGNNARITLAN